MWIIPHIFNIRVDLRRLFRRTLNGFVLYNISLGQRSFIQNGIYNFPKNVYREFSDGIFESVEVLFADFFAQEPVCDISARALESSLIADFFAVGAKYVEKSI